MSVRRPLHELKLPDKHRLEPQCRMQDYAAWGVPMLAIITLRVVSFGMIELKYLVQDRPTFIGRATR